MAKKVRLITGLILFAFLTCHLLNLSFGLVSLAALDESRQYFLWFWSTGVGVALLVGSMAAHLMIGLWSLYIRNTLRMNMSDSVQLVLGLLIFPLLFGHLLGTVIGPILTDTRQTYFSILTLFWVWDPILGLKQVVVTIITWIHGCIGLVIWLRIQSWWRRIAGFVYPLVVAIPLLAMVGMVEAGKVVIELNKKAEFQNIAKSKLVPNDTILDTMTAMMQIALWSYFTVLAMVLLARYYRVRKDRASLSVTYANGKKIATATGPTLLEISRMNNIPHASLCSGKGRCGTCRVRVLDGLELLPEATEIEQRTLNRVKADADTRLACQVVPRGGSVEIELLLPPYVQPKDLRPTPSDEISTDDSDALAGAAQ